MLWREPRAVPKRNVALVEEMVEALNRRDLDTALSWAAPEVEYDLSRTDSPLRGVYRGLDQVRGVDGLLTRLVLYQDHDEALGEAGAGRGGPRSR